MADYIVSNGQNLEDNSIVKLDTSNSPNSYKLEAIVKGKPIVPPVFKNNGFEFPPINSYILRPVYAEWTFKGLSYIQSNGSAFECMKAPEGRQTAVIQSQFSNSGSIEQSIDITEAATYKVRMQLAKRKGYGTQPIQIKVNGNNLGGPIIPNSIYFYIWESDYINLDVGTHLFSFHSTATGSDCCTFIDHVELVTSSISPDTTETTTLTINKSML